MTADILTPPLTLAELVTSVAASVPLLRRDLVERRLRHWAARNVLKALGKVHVGSGRNRLFAPETAYIAAVLMRAGDFGSSVTALQAVARVIETELARRADFASLWGAAKDRDDRRNGSVFLALGITLAETGEPSAVTIQINRGDGLITPNFYLQDDALRVVNLSDTFGMVRFP
jgi:hypothetical protein